MSEGTTFEAVLVTALVNDQLPSQNPVYILCKTMYWVQREIKSYHDVLGTYQINFKLL